MEFSDRGREAWNLGLQANQGTAGMQIFYFAESMADSLEEKLEEGKELTDDLIFDSTLEPGQTGFTLACVVSVLRDAWIYGDKIVDWYYRTHGMPSLERCKSDLLGRRTQMPS